MRTEIEGKTYIWCQTYSGQHFGQLSTELFGDRRLHRVSAQFRIVSKRIVQLIKASAAEYPKKLILIGTPHLNAWLSVYTKSNLTLGQVMDDGHRSHTSKSILASVSLNCASVVSSRLPLTSDLKTRCRSPENFWQIKFSGSSLYSI